MSFNYIYFNDENNIGNKIDRAENKKMVLRFVVFGKKRESVDGYQAKTAKI